jgi:segregation and condensation protein B
VNPEQDSGSLADRAAAWVPPWERSVDREPPDDRSTEDSDADAGTLDDPAALDREIDADIARQAGLPGPGTTETSVDADTDMAAETAAAEVDTVAETAPDIDPGAEPDAEGSLDSATETGVDPDADANIESDAADVATESAADVETDATADADREDEFPPPGPTPLPGLAGAELGAALEAILMVVDEPVTEAHLADVLDVAPEDVAERLAALAADYAKSGRGFELRRSAGGWRFYTRAEYSGYVERFVLDGQSARLTQAALETLAVVAYQQPVTRSRISAIRGVNCDGVVRTLVTRGLLEESGTQPETGAFLYRTTTLFLEKLGLDSVDELPPLAPFLPDDVNGFTDAQR